ncbi:LPS export ABC transporter periplasmic protein LptC [Natroniella sulfidigena]|uniref:LPS export ABC transporter periplasmic protein LptC n=1 Tax=Natroniella sulfidigena TaxID=723921 RepID=UPI00200A18E0|nr:LPS export ABC transporter periplasmic protein LptC [Natroniella sulfidigena]MCK8816345.1 LPS export ABC transporter periplasmic protein LptC [Natroniella sulfidigena]
MNKKKILLVVIVVAIGAVVLLNDNSTEEETRITPEPARDEATEERMAEVELEDAAITLYSEDETTKWELGAKSIQQFTEPEQVVLEEVEATISEDGVEQTSLRAARGDFDPRTGHLSFTGPITIESEDKLLQADSLNWNQVRNELIGQGNVLLKQSGMEITGEQFVSQIDLRRLRLSGEVEAITQQKVGEQNE